MLTSRQPIWIGWGRELTYLYNDPYKSIIGGKHPWALGQPPREVWREIWHEIGPMADTVMTRRRGHLRRGAAPDHGAQRLPGGDLLHLLLQPGPGRRRAHRGGIICANTDDTRRVIGERQLALLRELAARTADARTWQEACELERSRRSRRTRATCRSPCIYLSSRTTVCAVAAARRHPAAPTRACAALQPGRSPRCCDARAARS